MSTQTNSGGAGTQASGANPDDNQSVAYETYKRTLDEAKAAKAKLKELDDKLKGIEEEKLKGQNEWKTLAEQRELQLKDAQGKLGSLESTITDSFKLSAFNRQLGGKLRDDAYLSFVETDKIIFHPETKKVDEESVKAVVAEFVKKHHHLVDFGKGKMPNTAGGSFNETKISGDKSIEQMTPSELRDHIAKLSKEGLLK